MLEDNMKFAQDNGKINCIRTACCDEDNITKQCLVTSFEANTDFIPQNVVEALTPKELRKLELWMIERALLKSQIAQESKPQSILRALPVFLQVAIEAIDSIDELSIEQFQLITNKLLVLGRKLDGFANLVEGKSIESDTLTHEEVLKEQLSDIKKEL